ncbi:MAG: hypothetical protein CMM99_05575 [Rickettsiales bacterium]|nr:hypothetical protein [Rickettsiales bacterium]|tara:strand:+ start:380 stop:613 length:234 start_codon:yes stop_codon:yes gene_type:complete
MLRIGKKGKDIQTKAVLDVSYNDITSVAMWIGVVEKYGFDKTEAKNQIELFITSLGENVDEYNQNWYEEYKKDNLLN